MFSKEMQISPAGAIKAYIFHSTGGMHIQWAYRGTTASVIEGNRLSIVAHGTY